MFHKGEQILEMGIDNPVYFAPQPFDSLVVHASACDKTASVTTTIRNHEACYVDVLYTTITPDSWW